MPVSVSTMLLSVTLLVCCLLMLLPQACSGSEAQSPRPAERVLECRMMHAMIFEPGVDDSLAAQTFWDRDRMDRQLTEWSQMGYNAMNWLHLSPDVPAPEWQNLLIRHEEFPEARERPAEETEAIIEHITWLFGRARELGMMNFLYTNVVHYTRAFGTAHNLPDARWGVRNELTRAYTEAAIVEVFKLYQDLDGLYLGLGERLPGERTSYFEEAIVPGLKRTGRRPIVIVQNWQIPVESFLRLAPREIYDNTWLAIHGFNQEVITDTRPYPYVVEYAEQVGLPTILGYLPGNVQLMPFNSPQFAYEMVRETRKVENVIGFCTYWYCRGRNPLHNPLFVHALAYYGKTAEPYSDEPWVDLLEERYGDREAARHFLEAYKASAPIVPETLALVYFPGDIVSIELGMRYKNFVEDFPFGGMPRLTKTSPARGMYLIPVADYVRIVAADRDRYELKDGSETAEYQTHIWDYGTFDVIPPVHMRKVRELGERCYAEAQQAVKTVRKNQDEAMLVFRFMRSYMLMSRYYEKKVLTAISAMLFARTGRIEDRERAERLADETLDAYLEFANYMLDELNEEVKRRTTADIFQGGWEMPTLPQLIDKEVRDRQELAEIFDWPQE